MSGRAIAKEIETWVTVAALLAFTKFVRICVSSTGQRLRCSFSKEMTGAAQCLSDPELIANFALHANSTVENVASCCMKEVCGMECPLEPPPPSFGKL